MRRTTVSNRTPPRRASHGLKSFPGRGEAWAAPPSRTDKRTGKRRPSGHPFFSDRFHPRLVPFFPRQLRFPLSSRLYCWRAALLAHPRRRWHRLREHLRTVVRQTSFGFPALSCRPALSFLAVKKKCMEKLEIREIGPPLRARISLEAICAVFTFSGRADFSPFAA